MFYGNARTYDIRINLFVSSLVNEAHCQDLSHCGCKLGEREGERGALYTQIDLYVVWLWGNPDEGDCDFFWGGEGRSQPESI